MFFTKSHEWSHPGHFETRILTASHDFRRAIAAAAFELRHPVMAVPKLKGDFLYYSHIFRDSYGY